MTPADTPPAKSLDSAVHPPRDAGNAAGQPVQRDGSNLARAVESAERPESKSALIAFAFVEFHRLRLEGQPPDIDEWCALFPTCRSAVRRVLEVEVFADAQIRKRGKGSCDESIHWPREGEQRDGFKVLRELGRGAFARVYLAADPATGDRLVVLKCSPFGDAEARTMGRLSHPGVVPILSARRDQHADLTLICMPYRGSATLEDVFDRVRMAPAEALPSKAAFLLEVIRLHAQPEDLPAPRADERLRQGSYTDGIIHLAAQLAETLAFLHEHGVCHQDLKPSNVLLDPAGKPLLLDFNLSKSEREASSPVGGTLRYMAPEQLRAFLEERSGGIDERADLYALGVMIYELLGGASPFGNVPSDTLLPVQARLLLERQQAGFRSFGGMCPELEKPVAAILDRCLAFDVWQRPSSAGELATKLKRQFSPVRRLRRRLIAHRRAVLAVLACLAVAVALLIYLWVITPPYSQREYDRGRIAYYAGDYSAAHAHFDRASRADPEEQRFRYARGCALLQQSKFLPVDRIQFEAILSDFPVPNTAGRADAHTLAVRSYILIRQQKHEEAIKIYDWMEKSGNGSIMVLNNRAYVYMIKPDWDNARKDLDRAITLDPHCQAARYNRAQLALQLYFQHKIKALPPQALEDIKQALDREPRTSALYRDAALLYALAAKNDPQHAHFERARFYLRQAISAGETAAAFRLSSALRNALRRPEFAALLAARSAPASPQPELRLLDPVALPD